MPGVTAVVVLPTANHVTLTNPVSVSVCVSLVSGKINTAQRHSQIASWFEHVMVLLHWSFFPVLFFYDVLPGNLPFVTLFQLQFQWQQASEHDTFLMIITF